MKVAVVCQPEFFRPHYESELAELWEFMEFPINYSMSEKEYEPLLDYAADIIFFFRGEFVPDGVLRRLKGVKVAISSEPFPRLIQGRPDFTYDSLLRYTFFRAIRHKPFDYLFHYDPSSLPLLEKDGLGMSGAFALPVPTSVYRPLDIAKRWDLCFFGRSTAHRERFFGSLKHYYNFLHVAHGMLGSDLVPHLNASKICLNVHAENEISWEPRMQVMLATGAFVLSEPITENEYLKPGEHFVEVKSPAEMHEAVVHYINDEVGRNEIANRGRQRILSSLDCKKSFGALVDNILAGKIRRFTPKRSSPLFDVVDLAIRFWLRVRRV